MHRDGHGLRRPADDGGPAGLEAARTAALRGHHVELYDMASELGGQVRMAATAPHRADLGALTRWLADEVARLGVIVHLRTPVDPDLIIDAEPDEVVIATGSTPRRDGFQLATPSIPVPGALLPHVFTVWDVLGFGGRATIGATAVVFDDTGTFEAVSAADVLAAAGASVTIVSRHDQLGANIPYPWRRSKRAASDCSPPACASCRRWRCVRSRRRP